MVVKVSKPEINVREKISELDKPSGTAGQAMLAAETPQEQQALVGVGRRNMIINGAMQFDQRNSMAAVGAIPGTVYVTDRFALGKYGASTAAFDGQQVNVSSHPEGFKKALKLTVVTTDTPSSDEGNLISYFIEGFDIYRLGYGSIYAKPLTLSFWVNLASQEYILLVLVIMQLIEFIQRNIILTLLIHGKRKLSLYRQTQLVAMKVAI
jgi:hypothetical protein